MPLPLLIAGVAVAAGTYGAKKGYDAKKDFDTAERWDRWANDLYQEAEENLKQSRECAETALLDLGRTKFSLYQHSILPFVDLFSQIQTLEHKGIDTRKSDTLTPSELQGFTHIEQGALAMTDVIGGGVAALGAGGLAGLAVYGGVGAMATASTGTAIGALSGVAATNATLAWIGGGSLAAGGMGVAGGMAVLGGIVAGPVLAVGGMIAASKAEAAKENAYAKHDQAELAAEKMNLAVVTTKGIEARASELDRVLKALQTQFKPMLSGLNNLIENESERTRKELNEIYEQAHNLTQKLDTDAKSFLQSTENFWQRLRYFFFGNPMKKPMVESFNGYCQFIQSGDVRELLGDLPEFKGKYNALEMSQYTSSVTELIAQHSLNPEYQRIRFERLSTADQQGLHMIFSLAQTINNILEAQLFDEDGILTGDSRKVIEKGQNTLDRLEGGNGGKSQS